MRASEGGDEGDGDDRGIITRQHNIRILLLLMPPLCPGQASCADDMLSAWMGGFGDRVRGRAPPPPPPTQLPSEAFPVPPGLTSSYGDISFITAAADMAAMINKYGVMVMRALVYTSCCSCTSAAAMRSDNG